MRSGQGNEQVALIRECVLPDACRGQSNFAASGRKKIFSTPGKYCIINY